MDGFFSAFSAIRIASPCRMPHACVSPFDKPTLVISNETKTLTWKQRRDVSKKGGPCCYSAFCFITPSSLSKDTLDRDVLRKEGGGATFPTTATTTTPTTWAEIACYRIMAVAVTPLDVVPAPLTYTTGITTGTDEWCFSAFSAIRIASPCRMSHACDSLAFLLSTNPIDHFKRNKTAIIETEKRCVNKKRGPRHYSAF